MAIREASAILGWSVRHVYRVEARHHQEGVAALAHGNRGDHSPHRLPTALRNQIVGLVRKQYSDYNDYHLLREHRGIRISASSTLRICHKAGLPSPRKRRAPTSPQSPGTLPPPRHAPADSRQPSSLAGRPRALVGADHRPRRRHWQSPLCPLPGTSRCGRVLPTAA